VIHHLTDVKRKNSYEHTKRGDDLANDIGNHNMMPKRGSTFKYVHDSTK